MSNTVFPSGQCRTFFGTDSPHGDAIALQSACYLSVSFIQTFTLSLFLVRLYVAYAAISRYFAKFTVRDARCRCCFQCHCVRQCCSSLTPESCRWCVCCGVRDQALMHPMDARKKRKTGFISFTNEQLEVTWVQVSCTALPVVSTLNSTRGHGQSKQTGGRLSGYTDMSDPVNITAWSKIRVFMVQVCRVQFVHRGSHCVCPVHSVGGVAHHAWW